MVVSLSLDWRSGPTDTVRRFRASAREQETREYEEIGVKRSEINEIARRSEADRRRSIVFGGGLRRRKEPSESVSLAKDEPAPDEISARVADLSGKVEGDDEKFLANMAAGPDLGLLGGGDDLGAGGGSDPVAGDDLSGGLGGSFVPVAPAAPSEPGEEDKHEKTVSVPNFDIPGQAELPAESAEVTMGVSGMLKQPEPLVSAPQINPQASQGRRRMTREDLGRLIDTFNSMNRENNISMFVTATRSKLIRLTDEDYRRAPCVRDGELLIALSYDLKRESQARSRTATSDRQKTADDFMTGGSSTMSQTDFNPSNQLADALIS